MEARLSRNDATQGQFASIRWWIGPLLAWRTIAAILCVAAMTGVLATAASSYLFSGQEARIGFPLRSDLSLYRRVIGRVIDVEHFRAYAKTAKVDPEIFKIIETDLLRQSPQHIRFTAGLRLTRADFKDMPDAVLREIAPGLAKQEQVDLAVSASARDSATATRLAVAAVTYARQIILVSTFDDWRAELSRTLERERLDGQAQIMSQQANLESLDRRIAQLSALQAGAPREATGSGGNSVQVQVQGPRYLPVSQQLVGLQSERIDAQETLRKAKEAVEVADFVTEVFRDIDGISSANPDKMVAIRLIERALVQREAQLGATVPKHIRIALIGLQKPIQEYRSRFVDSPFSPPEPLLTRFGIPRSFAFLVGSLIGLLTAATFYIARALLNAEALLPSTDANGG